MNLPSNTGQAERARALLERIEDVGAPAGVEVGVYRGDMSAALLERADLLLFMVDSWQTTPGDSPYALSGDPHSRMNADEHADCEREARAVAARHPERTAIFKGTSVEAATGFDSESLDFVFLDADHSYQSVRTDITSWARKIKPGGLLCGHDYANDSYPLFGVQRAVDEFAQSVGKRVDLGDNYTWFIAL